MRTVTTTGQIVVRNDSTQTTENTFDLAAMFPAFSRDVFLNDGNIARVTDAAPISLHSGEVELLIIEIESDGTIILKHGGNAVGEEIIHGYYARSKKSAITVETTSSSPVVFRFLAVPSE